MKTSFWLVIGAGAASVVGTGLVWVKDVTSNSYVKVYIDGPQVTEDILNHLS